MTAAPVSAGHDQPTMRPHLGATREQGGRRAGATLGRRAGTDRMPGKHRVMAGHNVANRAASARRQEHQCSVAAERPYYGPREGYCDPLEDPSF